jgi:hypothetical protein
MQLLRSTALKVNSRTNTVTQSSKSVHTAHIVQHAPVPAQVVWSALTDYDNLGTFIPGLVENKCLQRYRAGCKLYQVSWEGHPGLWQGSSTPY